MARLPTLLSLLHSLISCAMAATFTLTNNCGYPVWPGILSNAGSTPLATTGFSLSSGETRTLVAPAPWSGRFWGRTLCSTDGTSGRFSCVTGDCGSGAVECSGRGAAPPATLAEFTLAGGAGMDFYDVSLVDGYNVPMLVTAVGGGGGGSCASTGCTVDLNGACPAELRVASGGGAVACRSACEAFGSPEYCCSGEYGSPATCRPSRYSAFFKNACPRAYSYAYDDPTSTFTCSGASGYVITFCPSTTSQKSGVHPQAAGLPATNGTMVYMGGDQTSLSSPRRRPAVALSLVAVAVALTRPLWLRLL